MASERSKRPDWPGSLIGVLLLWLLGGGFLALTIWPSTPMTTRGWVLLLVFGPPAWFALEWVGSRVFSRELGERISPKSFSWARILVALAVAAAVLVATVWWSMSSAK